MKLFSRYFAPCAPSIITMPLGRFCSHSLCSCLIRISSATTRHPSHGSTRCVGNSNTFRTRRMHDASKRLWISLPRSTQAYSPPLGRLLPASYCLKLKGRMRREHESARTVRQYYVSKHLCMSSSHSAPSRSLASLAHVSHSISPELRRQDVWKSKIAAND
jgi:hypothetical protein